MRGVAEILRDEEQRLDRYERRLDERDGEIALTAAQRAEIAQIQRHVQPVFDALSKSVPKLEPGEKPYPYRIRLAADLQKHSKEWARVDLTSVARGDPSAFGKIEAQILRDGEQRGLDWSYAPGGGLRARKIIDQAGNENTVFHGDPRHCWGQFLNSTITAVTELRPPRRFSR